MTDRPAGVAMCSCGDVHPLGETCPRQLGAEQAARDDAARDVARLWMKNQLWLHETAGPTELGEALYRLADAYGVTR